MVVFDLLAELRMFLDTVEVLVPFMNLIDFLFIIYRILRVLIKRELTV